MIYRFQLRTKRERPGFTGTVKNGLRDAVFLGLNSTTGFTKEKSDPDNAELGPAGSSVSFLEGNRRLVAARAGGTPGKDRQISNVEKMQSKNPI